MAQINAGRVRFVSRGTYNNSTQYYLFDLVDYNGSSYIAKGNTVGNLPTNAEYWQLIAEKGNTGNTGSVGPTGNGISSITKTGTAGLIDTYTITYTNGNTTTFTVSNGKGISNIEKTGSAGLIDNYRMTYNDGTYFDYIVTNGQDGEVTEEELQDVYEQMSSELEDGTGTGTSIDTSDSAYWKAEIGLIGNTSQATNIITYSCTGNESGNYYFVYNNINYQFTMPTVSSGDVIYFNTDTLKLYLLQTEIQTTTASTGTLITMTATPNPSYIQDIQVVKGSNNIEITNSDNTQSQNYPITLPTGMELCKIGDYSDVIFKNEVGNPLYDSSLVENSWYKKGAIGKLVLAGQSFAGFVNSDLIHMYTQYNSMFGQKLISGTFTKAICNREIVQYNNYSAPIGTLYVSSNGEDMTIKNLSLTTKEQWQQYFQDNPHIIYGVLSTPTYTQITDTTLVNQLNDIYNKLKTYQGVSHITQTNADLPFVLTLDYKKSNLLRIKALEEANS